MWLTYQTTSQNPSANDGFASIATQRRCARLRVIAVVRPSRKSGGAQSPSITFWSRWKLSIECSARCSMGENRASAVTARPAANAHRRRVETGRPRRSNARTTTA